MIKTTYELTASLLSFSLRRLRDRQNRVNDLEQGERQRLLAADHSVNRNTSSTSKSQEMRPMAGRAPNNRPRKASAAKAFLHRLHDILMLVMTIAFTNFIWSFCNDQGFGLTHKPEDAEDFIGQVISIGHWGIAATIFFAPIVDHKLSTLIRAKRTGQHVPVGPGFDFDMYLSLGRLCPPNPEIHMENLMAFGLGCKYYFGAMGFMAGAVIAAADEFSSTTGSGILLQCAVTGALCGLFISLIGRLLAALENVFYVDRTGVKFISLPGPEDNAPATITTLRYKWTREQYGNNNNVGLHYDSKKIGRLTESMPKNYFIYSLAKPNEGMTRLFMAGFCDAFVWTLVALLKPNNNLTESIVGSLFGVGVLSYIAFCLGYAAIPGENPDEIFQVLWSQTRLFVKGMPRAGFRIISYMPHLERAVNTIQKEVVGVAEAVTGTSNLLSKRSLAAHE